MTLNIAILKKLHSVWCCVVVVQASTSF